MRFLALLILFTPCGCTYDHMSRHAQKQYRKDYSTARIQNQVDQLRVLDTFIFRGGGRVYIQPIMVNRHGIGVYGYNCVSSHFGHVKFFLDKNDSVILVSRKNEDSLKMNVTNFLRENNFSVRKIGRAMKNLKVAYDILSADSF